MSTPGEDKKEVVEQIITENANEATVRKEKLKKSRSCSSGWLTRTLKKWDENQETSSIPALQMMRDRVTSQMKRLQQFHDNYAGVIEDPAELDEAETWMEDQINRAFGITNRIELQINNLKEECQISAIQPEPKNDAEKTEYKPSIDNLTSNVLMQPSPTPSVASIDAWIDELVDGVEMDTLKLSNSGEDLAQVFAHLEIDRDLPKVTLPIFDGSPILWPRFIEQFYVQIHSRPGLTSCRRMDLLQSHVSSEAKQLIQGLGYSGRNYVQALKELKFAFGHKVTVARAYLNAVTSGNIVPSGDPAALRSFYIAVRDCVTTLEQINYIGELASSDVLLRAARRIPNDKRARWNEFVSSIYQEREPTLLDLQKWLKKRVESDFNPYAVTVQKPQPVQRSFPQQSFHTTMNTSAEAMVQMNVSNSTCRLCSEEHHLSRCSIYMNKPVNERYMYVKDNRLCFNCLFPSHRIADCKSSVVCRESGCGKRHHTSLHRPWIASTATSDSYRVNHVLGTSPKVYFQVLPVMIQGQNGQSIKTFAILDSGSDITMVD